ncbi:MAG: alpha/beta hydrolase [Epsilonproteobacteria bacterium]|nr:alpha/beta hydrolase [Campylobacterota bacterium]
MKSIILTIISALLISGACHALEDEFGIQQANQDTIRKDMSNIPTSCRFVCSNPYGALLGCATPDESIEGATVERVMLYPRENMNSEHTLKRMGILVKYPDAEATVVMCHGFMCNKYDQVFLRQLFTRGRYNILNFDFRAHGEMHDGQVCTFGRDELHDVYAAAQFVKNHPDLKGKPVFAYGFSMGAVAAIEAQAHDGSLFDAMILDCPFDSSENVIRRLLERVKFTIFGYKFGLPGCSLLQRYAFHPYVQACIKNVLKTVGHMDPRGTVTYLCPVSPAESIKKITVPVFFINCKNDIKVPIEAIRSLYDYCPSAYKQLWITNGRCHFDSYFYSPEKYTERVRGFLEGYLTGLAHKQAHQEIIEDQGETYKGAVE